MNFPVDADRVVSALEEAGLPVSFECIHNEDGSPKLLIMWLLPECLDKATAFEEELLKSDLNKLL